MPQQKVWPRSVLSARGQESDDGTFVNDSTPTGEKNASPLRDEVDAAFDAFLREHRIPESLRLRHLFRAGWNASRGEQPFRHKRARR